MSCFRSVFQKDLVCDQVRHNHLSRVVAVSSQRYMQLYSCNTARARDKNSELFLRWLDEVRGWTFDDIIADENSLPVSSKATKRTLLAMILNAVYLGSCRQMADTAEQISQVAFAGVEESSSKPSDEVALHRICGWALKALRDHLGVQVFRLHKLSTN